MILTNKYTLPGELTMQVLCCHRAEKALEVYLHRPANRRESTTLATALMNPQAAGAHLFLMQNIGIRMEEAQRIYQAYAPQRCDCDVADASEDLAA
jgi:hypothetical protein